MNGEVRHERFGSSTFLSATMLVVEASSLRGKAPTVFCETKLLDFSARVILSGGDPPCSKCKGCDCPF